MSRILHAYSMRIIKNRNFILCSVFMLIAGMCFPVARYYEGTDMSLEENMFVSAIFMVIISSIFCSLFIGSEYSDGFIRNKITSGHSRISIYLSDSIACFASNTVICALFLISYTAAGLPLLGGFSHDISVILKMLFILLLIIFALSSVFLLVTELLQSKTTSAVVCILLSFILIMAAVYIYNKLSAPPVFDTYVMTENGVPAVAESVPNPDYISGTERDVYEFLYDFLPSGQAYQLYLLSVSHMIRLPLYSALIVVITTFTGILFFKKRNIR